MPGLFDFLNSINQTKEYLLVDAQSEKEYSPYMINRGLSLFPDTVMFANEINKYPDISKRQHYDFFINSIAARKRFSKWPKADKASDDLTMIANYFVCSYEKAKVHLDILTPIQVEEIRSVTNTGGRP